jgi:proteasome lid subunit RPN8/RPN11
MIRIGREQEIAIRAHGRRAYPQECCGFLLGRIDGAIRRVLEARPTGNARGDSPENRFLIDPAEFVRVQREAERSGFDILGFYHSHPDVAARPSQFDRDHAWPWYSYVILSVREGEPDELLSWIVPDESSPFEAEAVELETSAGA